MFVTFVEEKGRFMVKFEIKDTEKLESFKELEKKYLHPNDNFEE